MNHFEDRRYLASFDASLMPQVFSDVLVIGAGVAGLRAAAAAAAHTRVMVIAKAELEVSNTRQAQGGVAVALGREDSCVSHCADTLAVGQGLCDPAIASAITDAAPARIRELVEWGGAFDEEDGELALTLEGGHSMARIVHAYGDATGREVGETLLRRVKQEPNIQLMEKAFVIDLLVNDHDGCLGAVIQQERHGLILVWAKQTILASGGAGRMFRETTNTSIATGDGVAMAYRAGAELCDLEFYQFHPTALYIAGAARALISEAVRGEGGLLLNARNERFMPKYHKLAELAPRDTVSRAIVSEIRETGHTCAYLDVRHVPADKLKKRFPSICNLCEQFDLDITRDLVPIRPAAHYMIGGVRTSLNGTTSIPRLKACGEVACTGFHGANRLGSNSLLEGLVVGYHAGDEAGRAASEEEGEPRRPNLKGCVETEKRDPIDVGDVTNALRAVTWRSLGIERNRFHIEEAIHMLQFWGRYVMDKEFHNPAGWELQNVLFVARLMADAALMREESRGVHYRTDFDAMNDENWRVRLAITKGSPPRRIPVENQA